MSVAIALIDYDSGNLHSARRGLERAGAEVTILTEPTDLGRFGGVVLPGVGAFDPAMGELRARGFVEPLREAVARQQPFLGICVGLQLLFEGSTEGTTPGLGIVAGKVEHIRPEPNLTIPHMGWNQLQFSQSSPLWRSLPSQPWVYFVHSYHGIPRDPSWLAATTTHGNQTLTAAIQRGNLMATQFHPEKSGDAGQQILRNFITLVHQAAKHLV